MRQVYVVIRLHSDMAVDTNFRVLAFLPQSRPLARLKLTVVRWIVSSEGSGRLRIVLKVNLDGMRGSSVGVSCHRSN
jgi:hypothetical protein